MRSKHGQGKKWFGINVRTGKVSDMWGDNVIEPAAVKEQIIRAASEASGMILRVDDMIASGKMKAPPGPPPGGPGGMDY
jgi:archaeal chaperonin